MPTLELVTVAGFTHAAVYTAENGDDRPKPAAAYPCVYMGARTAEELAFDDRGLGQNVLPGIIRANPTSPLNPGRTVFSGVASAKSSLHFSLVYFRQPKIETVQQDLLMVARLGEATFADVDAAASWQDDIHHS